MMKDSIFKETADYFSQKISEHGASAKGVDWNGEESQYIRFQQLMRVVNPCVNHHLSVNDLGCGYGEIVNYIKKTITNQSIDYHGYDLCQEMIDAANHYLAHEENCYFYKLNVEDRMRQSDYSIASGIFNIQVGNDTDWGSHILATLHHMNDCSSKGFAFNCLTSYSDSEYMKDYLYYADPCFLFDYCKKNFSRNIAILHDYDLYEFTIIVRLDHD